ncbi:MAG: thiamine diphosphokinase [Kiritimatiellae bacterium]|nr:thiamine diphosphokinase [Kiritimatiellia bacterium]
MNSKTVILANGEFPLPGSEAMKLLVWAQRVVACDGAADAYQKEFSRPPDIVVGDLDSIAKRENGNRPEVIRIDEQQTNDLAKAIRVCRKRDWSNLVIVGACGKREDHTLGNIFLAAEEGIEIYTNYGRFIPVKDEIELEVAEGAAISIFALDKETRVFSRGLVWPLEGVEFKSLYSATLNRTNSSRLYLKTNRPILVYIAY